MQRLSYLTETTLSIKITKNRRVLSFKDSPRKPLRRRPLVQRRRPIFGIVDQIQIGIGRAIRQVGREVSYTPMRPLRTKWNSVISIRSGLRRTKMELCDPIEDWQQFRHFKMGSFLEEVLISAAIVIHCERGEAKINGPRRVKRRPNPNGCAFIRLLSSEFKGSRGVRQILFSKPPNKLHPIPLVRDTIDKV